MSHELSAARRDDKMSRRKPKPIQQWILVGGKTKRIEDGPLWPQSNNKKIIKKVANAKRRRRDKALTDGN